MRLLYFMQWVNNDCMHIAHNVLLKRRYGSRESSQSKCIGLNWHSATFIMHSFGIYSIIFMITTCKSINTLMLLVVVVFVANDTCHTGEWHIVTFNILDSAQLGVLQTKCTTISIQIWVRVCVYVQCVKWWCDTMYDAQCTPF